MAHARLEVSTRRIYQGYIDNHIKPALGQIPLAGRVTARTIGVSPTSSTIDMPLTLPCDPLPILQPWIAIFVVVERLVVGSWEARAGA